MEALIFDMDGVIIDSELYWNADQFILLKQYIPNWTKDHQQNLIGLSIFEAYKLLVDKHGLSQTEEEFMAEVNEIAHLVYREQCNLLVGFLEVIKKLKSKKIPIGLASSSKTDWIKIVIDRFKLKPYFDQIVSAEHIDGPSKPAPDIYLYTAKELGVDPADCTVIEDSKYGVLAGKAAGMTVLGFRNGFNEAQDLSKADHIIHGFKEFDLKKYL